MLKSLINFSWCLEDSDIGSESNCESEVEDFGQDKAQQVIDDYAAFLPLDQHCMWAVILLESFQVRQSISIKDAAQVAGSIVGFSENTVRQYRKDVYENKGEPNQTKQGKYERMTVYLDEELNSKAR